MSLSSFSSSRRCREFCLSHRWRQWNQCVEVKHIYCSVGHVDKSVWSFKTSMLTRFRRSNRDCFPQETECCKSILASFCNVPCDRDLCRPFPGWWVGVSSSSSSVDWSSNGQRHVNKVFLCRGARIVESVHSTVSSTATVSMKTTVRFDTKPKAILILSKFRYDSIIIIGIITIRKLTRHQPVNK